MTAFPSSPQVYKDLRIALLKTVTAYLENDGRINAAWVTGSISRGEDDHFSDIDLTLILNPSSEQDQELLSDASLGEEHRQQFISQFGEIANMHTTRNNVPVGGLMANTLYSNGLMVDYSLVPDENACRPADSLLLFERAPIILGESELNFQESELKLESRIKFFFLMASVAIKYCLRRNTEKAGEILDFLCVVENELQAAANEPLFDRRIASKDLASIRKTVLSMVDLMAEKHPSKAVARTTLNNLANIAN